MKKAILLLITILMVTFSFSFFGTADTVYAEATLENGTYRAEQDIKVYKNFEISGEQFLFSIPKTYYFKIVDKLDDRYYISYNDEDNSYYIKASESQIATPTTAETSNQIAFVAEVVLSSDTTTFYECEKRRISSTGKEITNTIGTITFIGFSTYNGTKCAYVKLPDNTYGFIPTSDLKVLDNDVALDSYTIPLSPNFIDDTTPSPNQKAPSNIDNNKVIKIVLIVGIVVPALVIMFLLFKPSKKSNYDYDRNRDYDMGSSPYDAPRSRYRDDYYDDRPQRRPRDDDDYYDNRRF